MEKIEIYLPWALMFCAALLSGVIITGCYIIHRSYTAYSRAFTFTILVVVVLMAAILNSVGSNIAASISLFGALSLLRFRSVVKSTDDMGFLLTAVTVGLIIGTKNYQLLPPVLIILIILVYSYRFIKVGSASETQTFVINYRGAIDAERIIELLKYNRFKNVYILSKSVKVGTMEKALSVRCSGSPADSISVIETLTAIQGVTRVKAISNEEV